MRYWGRPGGCTPCEYAALHVQALPTEYSYFYQWDSAGLVEPLEAESGEIPMIGASTNVIATFLDRPGLKSLDLLADLGEFLVEVGVYASAEEVLNLDVDYGGVSVSDGVVYYDENNVPDAAEFTLLEAAIKDTRLNLTRTGGLGSEHVWKSFHRNQAQVLADIPLVSDAAANALAAYITLGSNGHVGQAKAWALAEYGVQLANK